MEVRSTKELFHQFRQHFLRLVFDPVLPDLATWKGAAKLVGLWLILTIAMVLTPVYVLLRIPFKRGGYRFALMLLVITLGIAFIAVVIMLMVGMAGFAAGR